MNQIAPESPTSPPTFTGVMGGAPAVEAAKEALLRALQAQQVVRVARGARGTMQFEKMDDHRVQIAAANAILDRELGRATSKSEVLVGDKEPFGAKRPPTPAELIELARKNPEAVARIADEYLNTIKSAEVAE